MSSTTPGFMLVYFVYGFAFFSLGVALLLESRRMPSIGISRRLRPLAIFGILHGIHEWLEFFVIISTSAGMPDLLFIEWLRLMLLLLSFASLLAYGLQEAQTTLKINYSDALIAALGLLVYSILLLLLEQGVPIGSARWFKDADALARMVIAVPASLLAFFTLDSRSSSFYLEGRSELARYLRFASLAFILYAFSQIFVPEASVLYSPWLNAGNFQRAVGFPIQALRAGVAILIAYGLIRGTETVEMERQDELNAAQEARLAAAEQAQLEASRHKELQQNLLRSIVDAQEEERQRISRELHDETAQLLTALSLEIATLRNLLPRTSPLQGNTTRIRTQCQTIAESIKRLVHQLRPALLDDLGIVHALQYLADQAAQDLGLRIKLRIEGSWERIPPGVETVIYRVSQECLTNISRHAGVSEAELTCIFSDTEVYLKVSDAGAGFDPENLREGKRRIGLLSMRERVEALQGVLTIRSSSGEGTSIEAVIPASVQEASVR